MKRKQIKLLGNDGVTLDESSPVNRIDVYISNRLGLYWLIYSIWYLYQRLWRKIVLRGKSDTDSALIKHLQSPNVSLWMFMTTSISRETILIMLLFGPDGYRLQRGSTKLAHLTCQLVHHLSLRLLEGRYFYLLLVVVLPSSFSDLCHFCCLAKV